ncbi:MAG: DUF2059 domain-containing protein [Humidesulfovibrio sp.]|uniref:DUF2059 domain-containing protein n=1 Tax=Humidesulfovibrio sp. TaxID=2910988 RepID=UPI0027361CA2|nr:DUF2059 domain-containing protein [Humidesulfovibrio sp.]MDP2848985.1 DUF2059 domain-containing protein [Humidesulfovibrio sp.]
MLKKICAGFAALCLSVVVFASVAQAEELSPAKRQEVLRLIEAMGGKDLIMQFVRQNMGLVKKFRPDIPADKMPAVERDISALVSEKIAAPGGLADQLLPVFAKHFSPQEMRELAAFYESPVGRKAVAIMPSAMRESKDVAQRMAIGMIPQLNQRVNETLQREAQRREAQSPVQGAAVGSGQL